MALGGKSLCIVHESANLRLAARRIVFGKYLNCGQTCVAPDYVLCHRSVRDQLVEYVKAEIAAPCSFGGSCFNDVILHLATSNMGFGGVGERGMGSYHSKAGFDAFSHYKSIVDKKPGWTSPCAISPTPG